MQGALTITCIIPVFNCERYIERSLKSVLGQSMPPDEVLVIDDGSTDKTPDILENYKDRIRIIRTANSGPAAARNVGIKASKGDILTFLDVDDEWLSEKLARQTDCLAANRHQEMCITHIKNIWDKNLDSLYAHLRLHRSTLNPPGYVFQTLMTYRGVFDKVGLLNENLKTAEDVEWFSRAEEKGITIGIVPEVLVLRHLHGANISEKSGSNASERNNDLLDVIHARLKRKL